MPFGPNTLGNIVMVDVLHHIEHTLNFFREAARVLKQGGRVVMIEPGITPLSWAFFNFIHEEPVIMNADPLTSGAPDPTRDPYNSDQAIPSLIATWHRDRIPRIDAGYGDQAGSLVFADLLPIVWRIQESWSLLPERIATSLMRFERKVEVALGRYLGFRLFLVFEKVAPSSPVAMGGFAATDCK